MTVEDMPRLAGLIARGLAGDPEAVAGEVALWRRGFETLAFVRA